MLSFRILCLIAMLICIAFVSSFDWLLTAAVYAAIVLGLIVAAECALDWWRK